MATSVNELLVISGAELLRCVGGPPMVEFRPARPPFMKFKARMCSVLRALDTCRKVSVRIFNTKEEEHDG